MRFREIRMAYAITCKACHYVEKWAYHPSSTADKNTEAGKRIVDKDGNPTTPLTARGHVPTHCPKCGVREHSKYPVEATDKDIAQYDEQVRREARAVELCGAQNLAGLFKIPDEAMRGPPEVRNALSNLLAPLEGEILRVAQANIVKFAKVGVQGGNAHWVELFDRAVEDAKKTTKTAKVAA